jgi:hypothetical protein
MQEGGREKNRKERNKDFTCFKRRHSPIPTLLVGRSVTTQAPSAINNNMSNNTTTNNTSSTTNNTNKRKF